MAAPAAPTQAFVCIPDAIPREHRSAHFALADELFRGHVQERADLPDGYGFRFAPELYEKVALFVANERKCCPVVGFSIVTAPEAGPLWLYMKGPPGIHEFLRAELPLG